MNLLIDIGNSRLKWAWQENGRLTRLDSVEHPKGRFDSFAKKQWGDRPAPERVLMSAVGPPRIRQAVEKYALKAWSRDVVTLESPASGNGVVNAYDAPARLGSDRWAALVAVHEAYQAAACIVDCGTAITLDAINADGVHQGGLIVPGLNLMRTAISSTAPGVQLDGGGKQMPASLLARNTEDAVVGGTLYGVIAMIDRMVADITSEMGMDTVCVITGGDAPAVLPLLAGEFIHRPNLVLEGLGVIATEA
jgi:type III pantothenate kinase